MQRVSGAKPTRIVPQQILQCNEMASDGAPTAVAEKPEPERAPSAKGAQKRLVAYLNDFVDNLGAAKNKKLFSEVVDVAKCALQGSMMAGGAATGATIGARVGWALAAHLRADPRIMGLAGAALGSAIGGKLGMEGFKALLKRKLHAAAKKAAAANPKLASMPAGDFETWVEEHIGEYFSEPSQDDDSGDDAGDA